MWPVRRVAVVGCDPRGRGGADELIREKRRAEWLFCELCHNSHPVVILGPPSMTSRRVWDSLGIRPESVWNPPGIRFIGSTHGPVHDPNHEPA